MMDVYKNKSSRSEREDSPTFLHLQTKKGVLIRNAARSINSKVSNSSGFCVNMRSNDAEDKDTI